MNSFLPHIFKLQVGIRAGSPATIVAAAVRRPSPPPPPSAAVKFASEFRVLCASRSATQPRKPRGQIRRHAPPRAALQQRLFPAREAHAPTSGHRNRAGLVSNGAPSSPVFVPASSAVFTCHFVLPPLYSVRFFLFFYSFRNLCHPLTAFDWVSLFNPYIGKAIYKCF